MTIPHAIPMLTFVPASAGDEKQCILVLIGATPEGRKDLVGFNDGGAKVHRIGAKLLPDLKRRGLAVRPELAIADGALGFWKAAGEVSLTTGSGFRPVAFRVGEGACREPCSTPDKDGFRRTLARHCNAEFVS
jgi:hypothetical protein